ncbi:hypothetical protein FT663_05522, partial [Candidozyma haemuli var. vulneris]
MERPKQKSKSSKSSKQKSVKPKKAPVMSKKFGKARISSSPDDAGSSFEEVERSRLVIAGSSKASQSQLKKEKRKTNSTKEESPKPSKVPESPKLVSIATLGSPFTSPEPKPVSVSPHQSSSPSPSPKTPVASSSPLSLPPACSAFDYFTDGLNDLVANPWTSVVSAPRPSPPVFADTAVETPYSSVECS